MIIYNNIKNKNREIYHNQLHGNIPATIMEMKNLKSL